MTPQRIITGYRMVIDFRKLNKATKAKYLSTRIYFWQINNNKVELVNKYADIGAWPDSHRSSNK